MGKILEFIQDIRRPSLVFVCPYKDDLTSLFSKRSGWRRNVDPAICPAFVMYSILNILKSKVSAREVSALQMFGVHGSFLIFPPVSLVCLQFLYTRNTDMNNAHIQTLIYTCISKSIHSFIMSNIRNPGIGSLDSCLIMSRPQIILRRGNFNYKCV